MRKIFAAFQALDRNERFYMLGLILMLIGLTYAISLFIAMAVVGGIMVVESVLTSYIAGSLNARSDDATNQ